MVLFCCTLCCTADVIYSSPVHYPITLAGNFGEPRPAHFHGGIDVKTDRQEGKVIYAIASGYVSRVKSNVDGLGNAIYIRQPDGHTTIYCHLKAFSPRITAAINRRRAQVQNDSCEVFLKAFDIPVAEGQFIAFSGNSGHSFGPHLHLEIRQTTDWTMLDPLNYLSSFVRDTTAPEALAFRVYPQDALSYFANDNEPSVHAFSDEVYEAWGNLGFAIRANDHMDSVYNDLGVRYTTFYIDNRVVFRSNVDNIHKSKNPLINVWGDSAYYNKNKVWFLKSFIEPSNTLPILWADKRKGIIYIGQERDYLLKYVLSDIYGNTTTCEIKIRGKKKI